jgi:stage II sporulation protein M
LERYRAASHSIKKNNSGLHSFKFRPLQQYMGLMLLMLVGAAIGAAYVKNLGIGKSSFSGTGFFIQDIFSASAASKGFAGLAVSAFFPVALLFCVAYLLGLCAIGFPFELLVPVIHGAWLGSAMVSIDMQYGVKGLGICFLFIMPQAIITALAVMVACREGVKFSWSVAMTVFRGGQNSLLGKFRAYCFKYVVCFVFIILASVIEALSIVLFAKIFFA